MHFAPKKLKHLKSFTFKNKRFFSLNLKETQFSIFMFSIGCSYLQLQDLEEMF